MEEKILTLILDKLYINRENFFCSRKREFVDARILFTHFYIMFISKRKYGTYTILMKYLNKRNNVIAYYANQHYSLIKTNKEYKIKFNLIIHTINDTIRTTS
jgi:hypothetical protein